MISYFELIFVLYAQMIHLKLLFLSFFGFCFFALQGQDFSDVDKSPMAVSIIRNADNSPMARVIYSRPKMRGRQIFDDLVPYGEIWRTGANEATELRLYNAMRVNKHLIPAGTYTLYTIPNKKYWTVILNEKEKAWGTFDYSSALDVLRIKVIVQEAAAPIEDFSMAFQPHKNGANLFIGWENVFVELQLRNKKTYN